MKSYSHHDFEGQVAWLTFRLDTQVKNEPVDIYVLMDLASGYLMGQSMTTSVLDASQAEDLIKSGIDKNSIPPKKLLIPKGDPAIDLFKKACEQFRIEVEPTPITYLEEIIGPVKETFGQHFFSPSSTGYTRDGENGGDEPKESSKHFVPDSYDPCPCNSGDKFKFCCKPAFRDIVLSQAFAQEGKRTEAMKHLANARKILGETAEILCREAIVEGFFDPKKSEKILALALKKNPNHPRANYIQGIVFKEKGEFKKAIKAYEKAIENYPKTDRFHLNETYNNIGTAYFELGNVEEAKKAWEQALVLLPSDTMVKRNLVEFVYQNTSLPKEVRQIGPFVKHFFVNTEER